MDARELYAMDGADWLAARVGEDAQPSDLAGLVVGSRHRHHAHASEADRFYARVRAPGESIVDFLGRYLGA